MEWENDSEDTNFSPKPTISIPVNDDTLIFLDEIKDKNWFFIRIENISGRVVIAPEVDGIEGIVRLIEPLVDELISRGIEFK